MDKELPANTKALMQALADESVPVAHRSCMLIDVLAKAQHNDKTCSKIASEMFEAISGATADADVAKLRKMLKDIIGQAMVAPMRPATFISRHLLKGSIAEAAMVSMDNGELAFIAAHDQAALKELKMLDKVLVDAQGHILISNWENGIHTGIEARFERRVDHRHVEVINHQDERAVILAGPDLMKQIEKGEVPAGTMLIVGCGGRIATMALPPEDKGADNFRFLDRGKVPDIIVERDIGAPPRVIGEVATHIREEMMRPEKRRRFKLRPCKTWLLEGVSGSGKTLAKQAIHRLMYEIMSEVTGTPIDELPPRVFQVRSSKMLSMWLGESDKNADRIFDEVEKLALQTWRGKKDIEFRLPVLVVLEEIDGLARARGDEAVYDRIMTTILQRLDPNRHGLADQLIIILATTNHPHIVDPAMMRRIGGEIEHFGRLNAESFDQVFRKHVRGLPVAKKHGKNEEKAWNHVTTELKDWLFLEGIDPGVVELSFHGHQDSMFPKVRYHRDFLTGALVDRSVQQAATEAWKESISDNPEAGVSADQLQRAIAGQVASVARQLTPTNIEHYLDLPEGARVVGVRSILKATV